MQGSIPGNANIQYAEGDGVILTHLECDHVHLLSLHLSCKEALEERRNLEVRKATRIGHQGQFQRLPPRSHLS